MIRRTLLVAGLLVAISSSAQAADVVLSQSHSNFDTDAMAIKTGDTVVFRNNDEYIHDIQIINADGDVDDKGLQKHGEDIKYTFAKSGTYKVRCSIHPKMKATITVQ